MKLIIGLGNPGEKYANTRHNAGFIAIDQLLKQYDFDNEKNDFDSIIYTSKIKNEKVLFIKPMTFMNLSGEAINKIVNFYKVSKDDIIVIHDEKDFNIGKVQFKTKGSSGGHNGLKSIIKYFGEDFKRIRIGIDAPKDNWTIVDWVLSTFSKDDISKLQESISKFSCFVNDWIDENNFQKIISKYNPEFN